MIVLRTPKGWTAPREVDGHHIEGFWRAHQVPIADVKSNPAHLKLLEDWMRSYSPEELFDANGAPVPELRALAPEGERRMGANPHANGGLLRKALRLPDLRDYALAVESPGPKSRPDNTRPLGAYLRDVMRENPNNFRVFGPDENTSNKLDAIYEASGKFWIAERFPEDDDGAELDAGRPGHRDALRAHARRHARGLSADRPPRLPVELRGVRARDRLDVQPARQVAGHLQPHHVARGDRVAQPAGDLHGLAAGSQRLHPSGSGLHRRGREQESVGHAHLPAAGRELPARRRRPLPRQPQPTST